MAEYQLHNGVTTICPASMTFSEEQLTEIFKNAANYKNDEGASLVGINMEGPFISMEKKGAQNGEYIHKPDADMFERLQTAANGLIKLCDIAPEVDGACIISYDLDDKNALDKVKPGKVINVKVLGVTGVDLNTVFLN